MVSEILQCDLDSSLDKQITSKCLGTRSCFEVTTYIGAPLGGYSQLPHEKELLIPPYEVFNRQYFIFHSY